MDKLANAMNVALQNSAPDTETEAWIRGLGVDLIDVFLILRDGTITSERHVRDSDTLETTVKMSLDRLGGWYAVYPYEGRWALYCTQGNARKKLRYYDTKEAAEMVAIHHG